MPVLKTPQVTIKQFYLPSTSHLPQDEQAWVKVNVGAMLTGDVMTYSDDDGNVTARMAKILVSRISEWNLTDEAGTALVVNFENLCKFPVEDFNYLIKQETSSDTAALTDEEKKS